MKTKCFVIVLLASTASNIRAQIVATNEMQIPIQASYIKGEAGPHHRQWLKVASITNTVGHVIIRTNVAYQELASGLHYRNANGQWVESKEQIDILAEGGAAATNGQHQVYFPSDLYDGVIELVTPDGIHLQSRPLGIAYFDGTNSVLIAELTNSVGQILPSGNQVIYTNAFTDFAADLLCTYRKGGFESDVIFRQRPPAPEEFGLNRRTSRLQLLTEWFNPPEPEKRVGPASELNGLTDTTLVFGAMKIGQGKAFSVGDTNENRARIPVYKTWEKLAQPGNREFLRTFLIEEVSYERIEVELNQLAAANPSGHQIADRHLPSRERRLPSLRAATPNTGKILLARSDLNLGRGVVLDYQMLSGSTNDFTFQGDSTYYISGDFNIYGAMTIEGGTVIKFSSASTLYNDDSSIACKTSAYRPAIFTASDDNSVGQSIANSTGNPTNNYAANALMIDFGPPAVLQYLRFSYASCGVNCSAGDSSFRHCQFVKVGDAFQNFANVTVENVLFNEVSGDVFQTGCCGSGFLTRASHLTVHHAKNLLGGGMKLEVTNSLFSCVTNWGGGFTNAVCATNDDSSIFQVMGAGSHYLVPDSPYRNAGTTNINASLLAHLETLTTYAPALCSNLTLSVSTTWGREVSRDTDVPDLGYHYPALDYLVTGVDVNDSSAALALAEGVAVATFGPAGLQTEGGASLLSQGTPRNRVQLCSYQAVQEQPVKLAGKVPSEMTLITWAGGNSDSVVDARFTDFNGMSGLGSMVATYGESGFKMKLSDCYIGMGGLTPQSPPGGTSAAFGITNNIFERATFHVGTFDYESPVYFYNNTVRNSSIQFDDDYAVYGYRTIRDNLFDNSSISVPYPTWVTNDHNAYLNTTALGSSSVGDVTLTNFTCAAGPLGGYYQYSTNLINRGSRGADLAGLYHFTTQTNQMKETNSVVDIGFHYVAVDGSGNPLDWDAEGLPDYLEDSNGNGSYESTLDLSNWKSSNTDGDDLNDFLERIQGRNPRIAGSVADNGTVNLQVYTPLK